MVKPALVGRPEFLGALSADDAAAAALVPRLRRFKTECHDFLASAMHAARFHTVVALLARFAELDIAVHDLHIVISHVITDGQAEFLGRLAGVAEAPAGLRDEIWRAAAVHNSPELVATLLPLAPRRHAAFAAATIYPAHLDAMAAAGIDCLGLCLAGPTRPTETALRWMMVRRPLMDAELLMLGADHRHFAPTLYADVMACEGFAQRILPACQSLVEALRADQRVEPTKFRLAIVRYTREQIATVLGEQALKPTARRLIADHATEKHGAPKYMAPRRRHWGAGRAAVRVA